MDKHTLDTKVSETARTLLSYCAARTANPFEAEDLAQDIILEIYKSADHLRSEEAFYGFMWSIAGNVYKNWCKKKARNKECALSESLPFATDSLEDDNLYLLRRELSLLSQKYRKALILYYIQNKSCSEISSLLSVSESMVKYLLFKSRQLLKEGMNMERNYGHQSYHPKELTLQFWGGNTAPYCHLCDSKISQNILFACYHEKLTAEQISLEIGVSLPYMEDKLDELCVNGLLVQEGKRYATNIVLFTEDFANEVQSKTAVLRKQLAAHLEQAITTREQDVRAIGFAGCQMSEQVYRWQMTCFVLYQAIIESLQSRSPIAYPESGCLVWGVEDGHQSFADSPFGFGISNMVNKSGDYVQFMDFPINGEMVHHFFYHHKETINVFLAIAKGDFHQFSENDLAITGELIRRCYVRAADCDFQVNAPVLTSKQFERLKALFADTTEQIAQLAETLMTTVAKILKEHIPTHLKELAHDMAYLRLFEDAISSPVSLLYNRRFLLPDHKEDLLPTTYVILK